MNHPFSCSLSKRFKLQTSSHLSVSWQDPPSSLPGAPVNRSTRIPAASTNAGQIEMRPKEREASWILCQVRGTRAGCRCRPIHRGCRLGYGGDDITYWFQGPLRPTCHCLMIDQNQPCKTYRFFLVV